MTDKFSQSNLLKVGAFCQYITENWTEETNLRLTNFGYINGEKLLFFVNEFHCCIHLDRLSGETYIGDAEVAICTNGEYLETISLRNIVGNY